MEEARSASIAGLEKLLQEGISTGDLSLLHPHQYAVVIVSGIITLVKEEQDNALIMEIIMTLLGRVGKEEENV